MKKINYTNLKYIKKELQSYLSGNELSVYSLATYAIEFKKYISGWFEDPNLTWDEFLDINNISYNPSSPDVDCSIIEEFFHKCYYYRKLSYQEAYFYLKEINRFEKELNKIESSIEKNNNYFKKTG